MSDLISRKATIQRFIQETEDSGSNVMHINTIKRVLQDIDKSYDVDAVVEEIEKLEKPHSAEEWFADVKLRKTIKIIREGGV